MSFLQPDDSDNAYIVKHLIQAVITILVMSVVLLFMFLLVKTGLKWTMKRHRQATLRLFPRLPYSDIELGDRDTTCRICLSDFESTDNIYILPCTHLYHNECISTWMRCQITCPTYRCNYGHISKSWITCLVLFSFIILRTM